MTAIRKLLDGLKALLFLPSPLTTANSFEANPVIGSKWLNRRGLHRFRVSLAARMTRWRRARLAPMIDPADRDQFARNGFVVVEDVLPAHEFAALRDAIVDTQWPVRDMVQGDTITRRAAVDRAMMRRVPGLKRLLASKRLKWLMRYVSSYDIEPLHYVQSILKPRVGNPDPQLSVHADTFHPSMKAWLFLEDVKPGEGAFTYVRGSHRLTPERLAWEHEVAQTLPEGGDTMTRRGSFRISAEDLERLGLPEPEELAVRANTLVVADTYGFHARGPSGDGLARVELWSYSRRNPFLPWLGADYFSLPVWAPMRVNFLWKLRDRFPGWFKQPWRPVGTKKMLDTE